MHLLVSKVDPGYHGKLNFGMANMGSEKFEIDYGARIANITFVQAIGDIHRSYEGQWQGGRTSTTKTEKQN